MISLLIQLWSCTSTKNIPYQRTGEVVFIEQANEGTITLNSIAYASNKSDAIFYAEKNAFENLFFKGIPGSQQNVPMIPNEGKSVAENQSFFNNFFNNGEYRKFVSESVIIDENKNSSGIYISQELVIDVKALRKYLENKNVTRKFGF